MANSVREFVKESLRGFYQRLPLKEVSLNGEPIVPNADGTAEFVIQGDDFAPLMQKTFGPYTCTAASQAKGYLFFMDVVPESDNWADIWYVRYTVEISTDVSQCQGFYDVTIGAAGTTVQYIVNNKFYSSSYYPSYYHVMEWHETSAKYALRATNPIKIGERIYSAYGATTVARTFTVKVYRTYKCSVSFTDAIQTYDSFYTAAKYGKETVLNATSNGTLDNYDANTLPYQLYEHYSNYKVHDASTTPLYRYKICGFDTENRIVPVTVTNRTNSTQNTLTPAACPMVVSRGLVYYYSTTTVTDGRTGAGTIYRYTGVSNTWQYYNFNALPPQNCIVYLVGQYDVRTDEFTLDNSSSTSFYKFVPDTVTKANFSNYFEEGKCYWLVGVVGSTTTAYGAFYLDNPLYYFNGDDLIEAQLWYKSSKADEVWEKGQGANSAQRVGIGAKAIGIKSTSEGSGGEVPFTLTSVQGEPTKYTASTALYVGNVVHIGDDFAVVTDKVQQVVELDKTLGSFPSGITAYHIFGISYGDFSHNEGFCTVSFGIDSHAEGTETTAFGASSHAEGSNTTASGLYSHAEGNFTVASNVAEHAQGIYNTSNVGTIHSIGIGTADSNRRNAVEVMNDGTAYIYNIGGFTGANISNSLSLQKAVAQWSTLHGTGYFAYSFTEASKASGVELTIHKTSSGTISNDLVATIPAMTGSTYGVVISYAAATKTSSQLALGKTNVPGRYYGAVATTNGYAYVNVPWMNDSVAQQKATGNASYRLLFKHAPNDTAELNSYTYFADSIFYNPALDALTNKGGAYFATTSGTVGIGTATPKKKLDVQGESYFNGIVNIDSNSMGAKTHIKFNRVNYNYLNVPTGGTLAISVNEASGTATRLAVDNTSVFPGMNNNLYDLGKQEYHWRGAYVNKIKTQSYEIAETNSGTRIGFGTHDQTKAAYVNVGNLLVSNAWSDASKVPYNGIYSKGPIHVGHGADLSLSSANTGDIVIGDFTGTNVAIDNNEIMARNNGTASTLYLNFEGGDIAVGGTIDRLYSEASDSPMIAMTSNSIDAWLWKINKGSALSSSSGASSGFGLKYHGSASNTTLALYGDNTSGPQVKSVEFGQDGTVSIVSGNAYLQHDLNVNGNVTIQNGSYLKAFGDVTLGNSTLIDTTVVDSVLNANADVTAVGYVRTISKNAYIGTPGSQCHLLYDDNSKCLKFIFD